MSENQIDHAKIINDRQEQLKKELAEASKLHVENERKRIEKQRKEIADKETEDRLYRERIERENFYYETSEQKKLRYRMCEIGDEIQNINSSRSYVEFSDERKEVLLKEYQELKRQYCSVPYNIGKQVFKEIPTYETSDGSMKLEFRNNKWQALEYTGSGLMTRSLKQIETKDNVPTKILSTYSTSYIKRYFSDFGMPMTIDIEIADTFPTKGNPQYRLNFGFKCEKCQEQINDSSLTACPKCGTVRTR